MWIKMWKTLKKHVKMTFGVIKYKKHLWIILSRFMNSTDLVKKLKIHLC